MKKHKFLLFFLIFTVITLGLVKIIISNGMTTSGTVLGQLNEKVTNYQVENTLLAEKVLNYTSFDNISLKADKLGFVNKKISMSLTSVLPIAIKQ